MQKDTRLIQKRLAARMSGVTLIELLIVMVIVGILASVAYPAYQDQVLKTRRADGKAILLQTAQQLERCYTRFSAYNDANCGVAFPIDSLEEHYVVTAVGAIGASTYTLQATPQGHQADDTECGKLRLTNTGIQGSQGGNADANSCW